MESCHDTWSQQFQEEFSLSYPKPKKLGRFFAFVLTIYETYFEFEFFSRKVFEFWFGLKTRPKVCVCVSERECVCVCACVCVCIVFRENKK